MVTIHKIIFLSFLMILLFNCGGNSISVKDEILNEYNKGIKLYNNNKYSKAAGSFEYVILHSSGSKLALESEFYLAESFYSMKKYKEALYKYDSYARSAQDLRLIELSRFRLCECAYNLTAKYNKDQSGTLDALEKIEIFLEDYGDKSEFYTKAMDLKMNLRYKLAKKEYESARLYMKLGEYKSALIYLHDILKNYNNTKITDDVRLMIVSAYLLNKNNELASQFYNIEINSFNSIDKKNEAFKLIEGEYSEINQYLRLF